MNNKLLSAILIAGVTATGFAGISSANDTSITDISTVNEKSFWGKKMHGNRGIKNMSEEDKVLIESMNDSEKKEFFKAKKEELKANKQAKESVIDALLAGNTLTLEQEVLRAEIITQRAEKKAKQIEREEQKKIMKAIKEKKNNWEDLTVEEEELLDSFKEKHKGKKRWGKRSHK